LTGMIVRVMRFQSSLMESGITGWMLAVYFIALAGPMPKSQLFWMGTLTRLAMGFWSFLASSASAALSSLGASWANSAVVGNASALTSATASIVLVFISVSSDQRSVVGVDRKS